ncbi:MAG TPA: hypothetical protein PKH69_03235 [Thiobacillaceae bacterium]|nr:hypothetical protein [Thiobacillaceae bacterium]HNU63102.1 hypothetical protein [Thiobacillaceae bacterium]
MRSVATLLYLTLLAIGMTACASSREVRRADGWMTHVVGCGGPLLNMGHCLEKAGKICGGRGYAILNSTGEALPASPNAIPTGGLPDLSRGMEILRDSPQRKLYIKCH